ncbi:methyl-accepting chemotaxis protein [Clostridium vincentii]|nr:methyl-accepting chemotaxis protein [Clostridium vincentii]
MKIKSIKSKILISILPVVIGVMCTLTIISGISSKELIDKEIDEKMSYQLGKTEESIKNSLYKHSKVTESLGRTVETLGDNLTEEQYKNLIGNLIKSNNETFGGGVFYEQNKYKVDRKFFGPYVFKDNGDLTISDDYSKDDANYDEEAWYTIGKDTKNAVVWSDVYVDGITNKTMVTSTVPFNDKSGNFLGVATGDIDMEGIQTMVKDVKIGDTGRAILIDKNGSYLAGVEDDKIMNSKVSEDETLGLMSLAKDLFSGKEGKSQFENADGLNWLYYKTIPETEWVILMTISEKELNAPIAELNSKLYLTIVIAIILLIFLIVLFSKSLVKNIKKVNDLTELVKDGELSHSIEVNTEDELGQMSNNINEMIKNIRVIVKNISENLQSLVATSEELTASAEQTDSAAEEIAISIQDVATGSNEQTLLANSIVSESNDMGLQMNGLIKSLHNVTESSTEAVKTSQDGKNVINEAVNQINLIKGKVSQSSEIVNELGTKSNEIGQIVSIITSIAEQTNLLALNAAIEAARAGEQGKGFSVVADEVRLLAEQSSEAANEISKLIKEIQSNIVYAVEAMNDGDEAVIVGIKRVENAGQSFDGINSAISKVSNQMTNMTEVINNMMGNFGHMVTSIEKISTISENNADNTQGVAAASQEQTAIMKEVVEATKGLVEMAESLESSISFFKN